ncbi:MAG TPA: hypothetical protein VNY05_37560 [Candidatus Acidoferrales bacterium]|jgi:hypothetical protein|nr:hypothetical protein [Candidatus Acidoferrales bacterium]
MRSPVKPNGDLILQADLNALLEAEAVAIRLAHAIAVRIAAGARVQRGKLDVEVRNFYGDTAWRRGDPVNPDLNIDTDIDRPATGYSSAAGEFEIGPTSEVRATVDEMLRYVEEARAAKAVVPINTATQR